MTGFSRGLPPWQPWWNLQGVTQQSCFGAANSDPFNSNLARRPYSNYPIVPPSFARAQFFNTSLRINALTHCPQQVRRRRLKETGMHGQKDVYENYPGLFREDEDLKAMAILLDKERSEVRAWATSKLKLRMLSRAHALNLQVGGLRVNKLSDISKSWENDNSDANAKKMYEILFGDFEGANVSWSFDWEDEYLMEKNQSYVVEKDKKENKRIGCYREQITMTKIAQVKNINRNLSWRIQMSVPKEYKHERNGRRKKGDFYLTNKELVNISVPSVEGL